MNKKMNLGLCLTLCFIAVAFINVYGATTKSPITAVTLTAHVELQEDDDIKDLSWGDSDSYADITKSSSKYYISDVSWEKPPAEGAWSRGDVPRIKIVLLAGEHSYFSGTYNSSKVSIKGGTFESATRKDLTTLTVIIKLKPIKGEVNLPDEITWNQGKLGQGSWSKVNGVTAYEARLYRESKLIHTYKRINGTSHNFYPYMTEVGNYNYSLRPTPVNESEKQSMIVDGWGSSDDIYIDYDQVSDGKGQERVEEGLTDGVGGWIKLDGHWFFQYPDGHCEVDGWMELNGASYLFDNSGKMLTGWQKHNEKRYYLKPDGSRSVGWLQDSNAWYYLDAEGAMQTGWLLYKNHWYYLNNAGIMVNGWVQVGANWHYFDEKGVMAADTYIGHFYVNTDGVWVPEH